MKNQIFIEVRLPKAGLANKLFILGQAIRFKVDNNGFILKPNFSQLMIGPFFRSERDLRFYGNLFTAHPVEVCGIKKFFIKIILNPVNYNYYRADGVNSNFKKLIIIDGQYHSFESINSIKNELRDYIFKIIKIKWIERAKNANVQAVGVHVRLGDFGKQKQSIFWYVDAVNFVRSIAGNVKVTIFSDGSRDALQPLLALDDVELIYTGSAVSDLIALSRVKFLIGTGASSFSAWACFLGGMPAMTRLGNPFTWFDLNCGETFIGEWNIEKPDPALIDAIKISLS